MIGNAQPKLPRNPKNPIGQTRRIARSRNAVHKRLAEVQKWLIGEITALPVEALNRDTQYRYLVDLGRLRQIIDEIKARLGDGAAQTVASAAQASYREGVAMASLNLSGITDDYTRDVTQALLRDEVLKRSALAGARVFEQMEGFTGDTAADLARVIMSGVEDFRGPRVVARQIRKRFGVARTRAERIARTEITGAMRRGRLDEATDAEQRLGIEVRMIWYSALLPTTRWTHAARHGKLYTPQDVREFYEVNGNAINCRCSQVEAVLGADGQPLSKGLLRRLAEQRKQFVPEAA